MEVAHCHPHFETEVIYTFHSGFSVQSPYNQFDAQARLFAEQVLHMNPRVNAAGFFNVSKSILPSVGSLALGFLELKYKINLSSSTVDGSDTNLLSNLASISLCGKNKMLEMN